MRRQIPVTDDIQKMEKAFREWSGEKTSSKSLIWALRFAYKYYPIIKQLK